MEAPPFVFILGCGRSGTTLLRSMLDAHPDVYISNEARFPATMVRTSRRYRTHGRFDVDRFVSDLWKLPDVRSQLPDWGLTTEDAIRHVIERQASSVPDAIRSIYALGASRQGKSVYGDKTPGYTLVIADLAKAFPEARFIHIVRDGRDVASSYLEAGFGPSSLVGAATHWQRHVTIACDSLQRVGPTRSRLVRYERLVEDPEATLRHLADFIGVGYEPTMLRYFENKSALDTALGTRSHFDRSKRPPMKGIRSWERDMSGESAALFDVIAGRTLARLGYPRGTDHLSSSEKLLTRLRTSIDRVNFEVRYRGARAKTRVGDVALRSGLDELPRMLS